MDKNIEYLPLGSVVIIEGGIRKYVIVARGIQLDINGENTFFDYGACMYPMGMVGDQLIYFHHKDVKKVVFRGYSDEEDVLMVENINNALEKTEVIRGDIEKLKENMEK